MRMKTLWGAGALLVFSPWDILKNELNKWKHSAIAPAQKLGDGSAELLLDSLQMKAGDQASLWQHGSSAGELCRGIDRWRKVRSGLPGTSKGRKGLKFKSGTFVSSTQK